MPLKIFLNNYHFCAILPLNRKNPSNLNNGSRPKMASKRKVETVDIISPDKPQKKLKPSFDPKAISIEQLDSYVHQFWPHLQSIIDSKKDSWRHNEFLRKSYGNTKLDTCTGFQLFKQNQVVHISDKLFSINASESSSKRIVNAMNVLHSHYKANVLVPEILMLICCDAFNLTSDQVDDLFLLIFNFVCYFYLFFFLTFY